MARVFKRTDRITIKIDDTIVKVAPLSMHQKVDCQHLLMNGRLNGDIKMVTEGVARSLKYAVKSISGLTDAEGKPYVLEFEPDGSALTDDCVDDLLNLELTQRLTMVCAALVKNVPDQFTDNDGMVLDGVEILPSTSKEPEIKNV